MRQIVPQYIIYRLTTNGNANEKIAKTKPEKKYNFLAKIEEKKYNIL